MPGIRLWYPLARSRISLYIDDLPTEPEGIVVVWAIGFGSVQDDGRLGKDIVRINFIMESIIDGQQDHGIVLLE